MRARDRGFTLLELLIGFFILASASVIFLQTMHRFKNETAFTSENYLASSLIEKVLEQCYQESQLNPHGMTAVGLADAAGSPYEVSTSITDKETVFFAHPPITEDIAPDLHYLLKDNYTLSVETEKKDGYYEMVAGLKWSAKSGKGELFSRSRILAFTGEKEVITSFELSDDAIEERLVKDVFSSPGSNLGAELGSIGARKMLVHVGHIFYSSLDWLKDPSFAARIQQAASLEVFTQPGSDEYAKCSKLYFEMARDLLHLMVSLHPHIKGATDNISFLNNIPLPERFVAESRINRSGLYYRQLRRIFISCILKLSERYEQQLKYADFQRSQRQMVGRLFNINRILYANRAFSEEVSASIIEERYSSFLDAIQVFFKNKDASIYRMAQQERDFIAANRLAESFFVVSLTGKLFKEIDDYVNVLD
ncbi:MAG TPA: hypothetical protein DCG57_18155 [Candidatus Riflebacteria bacterium]|jgi:type II secretory pathway pseudopilin PulG|nr:hypothetical protein [Candidatus Riflebacteria bacterium]